MFRINCQCHLVSVIWSIQHPSSRLGIVCADWFHTHVLKESQLPTHPGPVLPKDCRQSKHGITKISGGIFCTQFVQCNDGGSGDKCMFLSVFTYSSNPLTQICEIVQLTRWAHRKFPQYFLPSSRHKKHGECLLLILACKFRRSQHVNLKLWLFHVIGVKRYREAECVHWGSETGNRSIRPTVVQPRVLQPQIVQLRSIRPKCQVVQPHIP